MGIIRLLLALSVVSGHLQFSSLGVGTTGQVSVQAFFLISGFYISMALCASYSRQVPQFWLNRALRLYPAYLLVAAAALVFEIASVPGFISAFASLPASATAILVLSNVLLFGQDWVMFLGVQHGSLHFFKSFTEPYHGVCLRVDCTATYHYARQHHLSVFLSLLHRSLVAAHQVENFRTRVVDGTVWRYEQINAGSAVGRPNGTIGLGHY